MRIKFKKLLAIATTTFMLATGSLSVPSQLELAAPFFEVTQAEAGQKCRKHGVLHDRCGPNPNTQYRGGGYNPQTVRVTVCLPNDLWQAIQVSAGAWWDFGLYYGGSKPEEVATVSRQCRRQNIAPGTWAIAYINCPPVYQGWVYVRVGAGDAGTTLTLVRGYPFRSRAHDPLS